jgi:hypothetical protein
MKLVRKWHPEDAQYIDNPLGPKVYRVVALVRDDVFTHYVCFYDTWTGKVYAEKVATKHAKTKFGHTDLMQIDSDQEWQALFDYLRTDECQVIQMVETSAENTINQETGEKTLTLHDNLNKLPRSPYGVDSNGSKIITSESPMEMQISPSLVNEDGSIII